MRDNYGTADLLESARVFNEQFPPGARLLYFARPGAKPVRVMTLGEARLPGSGRPPQVPVIPEGSGAGSFYAVVGQLAPVPGASVPRVGRWQCSG